MASILEIKKHHVLTLTNMKYKQSYQTNNKSCSFEGCLHVQKVGQTDFTKAALYKFIYWLAAVDLEEMAMST